MRRFTRNSDKRIYIKVRKTLSNFFEYADEFLPDIYAIGIDKENVPYYVKRDSEPDSDFVIFNLYRAMLNPWSYKFTNEAWSYFRVMPDQLIGHIDDIDCKKSIGHGSALLTSVIRLARERGLKELRGEITHKPPSEQGIRQYNFYSKFNFHIAEDEKGVLRITLTLPPPNEQKLDL